jgi:hypothetical protein
MWLMPSKHWSVCPSGDLCRLRSTRTPSCGSAGIAHTDENGIVHEQTAVAARSMTEINIRFGPLCGFKSDMSRGPRSSKSCHLQCSKPVPLFDYFVRMQQERFWNREAECFR